MDLWGSASDPSYTADTLTTVFSSTKSLTAIAMASLVDQVSTHILQVCVPTRAVLPCCVPRVCCPTARGSAATGPSLLSTARRRSRWRTWCGTRPASPASTPRSGWRTRGQRTSRRTPSAPSWRRSSVATPRGRRGSTTPSRGAGSPMRYSGEWTRKVAPSGNFCRRRLPDPFRQELETNLREVWSFTITVLLLVVSAY